MDQSINTNEASPRQQGTQPVAQPTGLSSIELAARRGIGPMSPLGGQVWHGQAKPCVSCGQLARRDARQCDQCGQDLSPYMLEKMRIHAGPWYVLEHVRPFPGVSLERLIRQIRRGVLTRTTVVRGPSTQHQWRFAAETPMLSKYLGCCWLCQADVSEGDETCPTCGANLEGAEGSNGDGPRQVAAPASPPMPSAEAEPSATPQEQDASQAAMTAPADAPSLQNQPLISPAQQDPGEGIYEDRTAAELAQLSAAISGTRGPARLPAVSAPAKVGRVRASWIIIILVIVSIAALLWAIRMRTASGPSVLRSETRSRQPARKVEAPPVANPKQEALTVESPKEEPVPAATTPDEPPPPDSPAEDWSTSGNAEADHAEP